MKTRIITACVLLATILPCVLLGGIYIKVVLGIIAGISTFELLSICERPKANIYLYAILGVFMYYSLYFVNTMIIPSEIILVYLIVLLTCSMFDYGMPFIRLCYYFTAGVLVAMGLHAILFIRLNYSLDFILILGLATFGCDTGAYFAGRFFGKHKLNPRLSPKKTIEGSIGGIIFGSVIAIIYGVLVHVDLPLLYLCLVSIVLTITGQIGDLTFSSIKRYFEVKDFSQIFPGHGGCLDRFDSLLLNALVLGVMLHFISMVV